jgi:hypothetical protein
MPQIRARVAFDGVKFLGMRMALVIEPELVVEPNRIQIPSMLAGLPFPIWVNSPTILNGQDNFRVGRGIQKLGSS